MNMTKQHFLYTVIGAAVTAAFGALLLAVPDILGRICLYTGILFCIVGAVLTVLYFVKQRQTSMHLLYGIVCIVLGVLLCIIPSLLSFLVPILFGLWILAGAGAGLYKNVMNRQAHSLWWVGMILCIIGIGIGVFIITRPVDVMQTTVKLIGIGMIVHGILRLVSAVMGRKAYSAEPGQVIETTIKE